MEVHEEQRHGIQQPLAVAGADGPEPHQQAPVLHRVAQVLRDQDRVAAARTLGQAHGPDRRQAGILEVAQDVELAVRDLGRQLLERVDDAARDEEADEVPRRADGQLPEAVGGGVPAIERQLPWQVEERGDLVAEAEAREHQDRVAGARRVRGPADQGRLRR